MPVRKSAQVRHVTPGVGDLEDEVRRLRDRLFLTRQEMLHLLDPQDLLAGYFGCNDHEQLKAWRSARSAEVISKAWVRPGEEMGDPRWPRAICPLCKQGAQGARDVVGFAVPEGLRRHLLGELNSRQCAVFNAAESIARDSIAERRDLEM